MFVIWSRWAPPLERQKLLSLCFSGSVLGIVLTYPTVGILCDLYDDGWKYAFYLSGIVTIIWCVLWYYFVYDTPSQHPRISKLEKMYIRHCLKKDIPQEEAHTTPWIAILSSPAVWAYVIGHTAVGFHFVCLIALAPRYLQDVHYFSNLTAAGIVAITYIGFFASCNLSAAVYDKIVARKICSGSVARKTGSSIGLLVPAVLLIFAGFLNCNHSTQAVVILAAINTVAGIQFGAGYLMNVYEIAPQHAGVIFGFASTITSLSAMAPLTLIAKLTTSRLRSGWQITFLVLSAVFVLSSVMFILIGSGELQKWAKTPEDIKYRMSELKVSRNNEEISRLSNRSSPVDIQESQ
ncbi:unnamed protein product [Candidula unifasciata]|uniref:Major facilitator superfamily (MFS) profile domain-containing protein n=1 Tax=Candidula unifasciata TaxID=100452 RepID=A0A8S3ZJ59_9EUPU|nr:unnamed protein product [Candidula unifasciata]